MLKMGPYKSNRASIVTRYMPYSRKPSDQLSERQIRRRRQMERIRFDTEEKSTQLSPQPVNSSAEQTRNQQRVEEVQRTDEAMSVANWHDDHDPVDCTRGSPVLHGNEPAENLGCSPNSSSDSESELFREGSSLWDNLARRVERVETVFSTHDKLRSFLIDSGTTQEHGDFLLQLLKEAPPHAFDNLDKSMKTFLKTPRDSPDLRIVSPGEYLHIGIEIALVRWLNTVHPSKIPKNELRLDFSTDGGTEKGANVWPIQMRAVDVKKSKPFVVGVYRGRKKPASFLSFFYDFIKEHWEINKRGGIIYKGSRLPLKLRCLIADGPARASCLNCVGNNARSPCPRCKITGVTVAVKKKKAGKILRKPKNNLKQVTNGRVTKRKKEVQWIRRCILPVTIGEPRTNEEYERGDYIGEHQLKVGESPLKGLIGMATDTPFEYMHLVSNIMKRWLEVKVCGLYKEEAQFSEWQYHVVNRRIQQLSEFCPDDFSRKPRSLDEFEHFKATEYRQQLFHIGPALYHDLIPSNEFQHFLLLHISFKILSRENPSKADLRWADKALELYVTKCKFHYDETFMSFNFHGLRHLIQDVIRNGPLDDFSAYCYENNMRFMNKMLRKQHQTLQQVAHRLAEQYALEARKNQTETDDSKTTTKLRHSKGPFPPGSSGNHAQYKVLQTEDFRYTTNDYSKANSCCILKDKKICQIENIIVIGDVPHLVVKYFTELEDFYKVGMASSAVGVYKCAALTEDLLLITLDEIKTKGYKMPFWKGEDVVPSTFVVSEL